MNLLMELQATNELQIRALDILNNPLVRAAKQEGEKKILTSIPFSDEKSLEIFPEASREIATAAVLFATMDAECPIVLHTELLPRTVKGIHLPGSRALDDNPDTVYRFMPISDGGKYIIRGKFQGRRPRIYQFSLISESWRTMANFEAEKIACDENGTFEIEVDSDPSGGRENHIQTGAGACFIHVRDTLSDWSNHMPSLLEISRINPPTHPPLSAGELSEKCASYVSNWYEKTILLHEEAITRPANIFPQPIVRSTLSMLVTQAYSIGRFAIEPGNVLLLKLRMGSAGYLSAAITNLWGISNNPFARQASLNMEQAAPNPDGSYTLILSLEDPGVQNWLDPEGFSQGLLFLRWAAFDPNRTTSELLLKSQVVPLNKLNEYIPSPQPEISHQQRCEMNAKRMKLFERRWQ